MAAHPTATWVIQQLREAFPGEPKHRYLIFDNNAIFSAQVASSIVGEPDNVNRSVYESLVHEQWV